MNIYIKAGTNKELWEQTLSTVKANHQNITIKYENDQSGDDLTNIDVLVAGRITTKELNSANNLKAIFVPFTGINQLPLNELKKREIRVFNSHVNAPYIAEKALALALSLLGRIVELDRRMRDVKWSGYDESTLWTSLRTMRCGVLGMGEIGQNIVKLLQPFNPRITTLERYRKHQIESKQVDYYETVKEVCLNSDLVFISLPSTEDTINMIDASILSNMEGAFIVNVGRANIVNEAALYDALANNTLKGAAFDVWYQYRDETGNRTEPSHFPIHKLRNVVLSPHCSAHTEGAGLRHYEDTAEKLNHYLSDPEIITEVDINKGY